MIKKWYIDRTFRAVDLDNPSIEGELFDRGFWLLSDGTIEWQVPEVNGRIDTFHIDGCTYEDGTPIMVEDGELIGEKMTAVIKAPYTNEMVELITYEKSVEMIEDVTFDEVFELAWGGWFYHIKDGLAELNLVRGRYESNSLGQNESNRGEDAVAVTLYKIDMNQELSAEDLLDEDERKAYEQNDYDLPDWMETNGIDYMERVKEYFQSCWENGRDYWERKAKEELEEWYNKGE